MASRFAKAALSVVSHTTAAAAAQRDNTGREITTETLSPRQHAQQRKATTVIHSAMTHVWDVRMLNLCFLCLLFLFLSPPLCSSLFLFLRSFSSDGDSCLPHQNITLITNNTVSANSSTQAGRGGGWTSRVIATHAHTHTRSIRVFACALQSCIRPCLLFFFSRSLPVLSAFVSVFVSAAATVCLTR